MNVGTFVQVMVAPYWVWMMGEDVDAMWRWVYWKPATPGAAPTPGSGYGVRPERARWNLPVRLYERFTYRQRPAPYVLRYGEDEATIRRLALLRMWDLGERFDYVLDPDLPAGQIRAEDPQGKALNERQFHLKLGLFCPGLWLLLPLMWITPVGRMGRKWIGLPGLRVG